MNTKTEGHTPRKTGSHSKQDDDDPFTPSRPSKVDLDLTPRGGTSDQGPLPTTPLRSTAQAGPSNQTAIPSTPFESSTAGSGPSLTSPLGASTPATASADAPPPPAPSNSDTISIRVREGSDKGICYILKRATRMEKLMNAYCKRVNKNIADLRFIFDGSRVEGGHTPDSLEMEGNEVIDVVMQQFGGCQD